MHDSTSLRSYACFSGASPRTIVLSYELEEELSGVGECAEIRRAVPRKERIRKLHILEKVGERDTMLSVRCYCIPLGFWGVQAIPAGAPALSAQLLNKHWPQPTCSVQRRYT